MENEFESRVGDLLYEHLNMDLTMQEASKVLISLSNRYAAEAAVEAAEKASRERTETQM